MKYLVAGLGNIGDEYANTRHNIGFIVLDALVKSMEMPANQAGIFFKPDKLASRAEFKFKQRTFVLIKPSTYMNLSGKAVNYWLQQEKISIENLLVITDDIALPFGVLRLRAKGSDGGHNGLNNINETLGRTDYARLRFGVGNDFPKGRQVDYVLGKWSVEQSLALPERTAKAIEIIKSFGTIGLNLTMTNYNNK
ncbi:MAG: aminoacyl-tRNA hydrolase [Bacteroidota bacterium]